MSDERLYYVISPEHGVLIPVTDDGEGPTEYGCEVVEVMARTKREAVIKGVAIARKHTRAECRDCYFRHGYDGDTPPWKGWHAEFADDLVTAL